MQPAILEHVNITVSNLEKTADMLCDIFNWHIRWQGDAIDGGTSMHVGNETCYVAIYSKDKTRHSELSSYDHTGSLNHIAMVVDDLDEVETRVKAHGYQIHSQADYEPGRRFYFKDHDGIEIEVVSYK